MQLPYSDKLEIQFLSRLFDKKSESYKLFWFQAIVSKVIEGQTTITYNELINEMVADAWYMVSEYRLNLGPADTLETLVHHVFDISGLKSSEKKESIIGFLKSCNDKETRRMKRTLTYNVPYRLQAPFMEKVRGKEWDVSEKNLVTKINSEKRLIYYFNELSGMDRAIIIQPEWCSYIIKNQEIINGWIQYNMIMYLQRRNPSVPGIANKLYPPQERKLEKVKKFWKEVLAIKPVIDIYSGNTLSVNDISIDHFVPWSYVAHDEMWNLHPTTKRINSSKSNNLPDWNKYFPALCEVEYKAYKLVWQHEKLHSIFIKCEEEHVNNNDVRMRLYRENIEKKEFYSNLEEIIFPVYQSAKNMGFRNWVLENEQ